MRNSLSARRGRGGRGGAQQRSSQQLAAAAHGDYRDVGTPAMDGQPLLHSSPPAALEMSDPPLLPLPQVSSDSAAPATNPPGREAGGGGKEPGHSPASAQHGSTSVLPPPRRRKLTVRNDDFAADDGGAAHSQRNTDEWLGRFIWEFVVVALVVTFPLSVALEFSRRHRNKRGQRRSTFATERLILDCIILTVQGVLVYALLMLRLNVDDSWELTREELVGGRPRGTDNRIEVVLSEAFYPVGAFLFVALLRAHEEASFPTHKASKKLLENNQMRLWLRLLNWLHSKCSCMDGRCCAWAGVRANNVVVELREDSGLNFHGPHKENHQRRFHELSHTFIEDFWMENFAEEAPSSASQRFEKHIQPIAWREKRMVRTMSLDIDQRIYREVNWQRAKSLVQSVTKGAHLVPAEESALLHPADGQLFRVELIGSSAACEAAEKVVLAEVTKAEQEVFRQGGRPNSPSRSASRSSCTDSQEARQWNDASQPIGKRIINLRSAMVRVDGSASYKNRKWLGGVDVDDPLNDGDRHVYLPAHFVAEMIVHLSVKDGLLLRRRGWWIVFVVSLTHAAIPFVWRLTLARLFTAEEHCQEKMIDMISLHTLSGWVHIVSAIVNYSLTFEIVMRIFKCYEDYYIRYRRMKYLLHMVPWSTMRQSDRVETFGLLPTFNLSSVTNVEAWNKLRIFLQTYEIKDSRRMQYSVLYILAAWVVLSIYQLLRFLSRDDSASSDTASFIVYSNTIQVALGLTAILQCGRRTNEIMFLGFQHMLQMKQAELLSHSFNYITEQHRCHSRHDVSKVQHVGIHVCKHDPPGYQDYESELLRAIENGSARDHNSFNWLAINSNTGFEITGRETAHAHELPTFTSVDSVDSAAVLISMSQAAAELDQQPELEPEPEPEPEPVPEPVPEQTAAAGSAEALPHVAAASELSQMTSPTGAFGAVYQPPHRLAEVASMMHRIRCYHLLSNLIEVCQNEGGVGARTHWAGEDRRSKLIFIYLDQRTVYGLWTSIVSTLSPAVYHFVTRRNGDIMGSDGGTIEC
jgi:hypothetical protein